MNEDGATKSLAKFAAELEFNKIPKIFKLLKTSFFRWCWVLYSWQYFRVD